MTVVPILYLDFDALSNGRIKDLLSGPSGRFFLRSGQDALQQPAVPSTQGAPMAGGGTAAVFNGIDTFAFLQHSEKLEVQNGTIAFWVKPASLVGDQVFVSKDESGTDAGGHFKIGMDDGRLVVRFSPGDGGSDMAWESTQIVFTEGDWTHVAVSFGADGVYFYVNGQWIRDRDLVQVEGWKDLKPSDFFEAHLLTNDNPLILGADSSSVSNTATPDTVADWGLKNHFNGAMDGFGIWGGKNPEDALTLLDIQSLVNDGPLPLSPSGGTTEPVRHETIVGTLGDDFLDGAYGRDHLSGRDGADTIRGGFGDDQLEGGSGNDTLDGGWGQDLLNGGAGDDVLISSSDAGEPFVAQSYRRGDGRNSELDKATGKLYPNQPLKADDILIGGMGADDFVFRPLINAKRDIILKHQDDDRRIDWSDVAGENGNVHDHWVDSIGTDYIADYDASEGDHIYIYGHTTDPRFSYRDVDGDGDDETIIKLYSNQGSNGGAHDGDFLGQIVVFGDRVTETDVSIERMANFGIVETVEDLDIALSPKGRIDQKVMSQVSQNPFLDDVDLRNPNDDVGPGFTEYARLRETASGSDDVINGTGGADHLFGEDVVAATGASLASPLSFWRLDADENGLFADARGVSNASAYDVYDARSFLKTGGVETASGPQGGRAAVFDGKSDFLFVAHDERYEVFNATITAWFTVEELGRMHTIIAKDESGSDDGGHFYIMIDKGGELRVRLADGEAKGDSHVWRTLGPVVDAGEWHHVAVSFTSQGTAIYLDGELLPDLLFEKVEGNGDFGPSLHDTSYLLGNDKPIIIGANSLWADDTSSAEILGQERDLHLHLKGQIAEVGIWGGNSPEDVLSHAQVLELMQNGPGALDGPVSGTGPILVSDDIINGQGGNDIIEGGAGDDRLNGDAGRDQLFGGYGNDKLFGGSGVDILEGGHGNDRLDGGADADVLISMADDREPRIAQNYRRDDDPDFEISPFIKMLYPSQARMPSSDVLTGGSGADVFRFVTLINAKEDIINKHVNADRTINWRGVAGENDNVHDHWVDGIGNDTITDFSRAGGDRISITGHTTEVYRIDYVDVDGVGSKNDSIMYLRSNQGANGGAHNMDRLGTITVLNTRITKDDYTVKADVFFGIINTIDQIAEAITPLFGADEVTYALASTGVSVALDASSVDPSMPIDFMHLGASVVTGSRFADNIFGSQRADELSGGNGRDHIAGANGSDILAGGGKSDILLGGNGNDVVKGQAGHDRMFGGNGNDTLKAGGGNDFINGGSGNDQLFGDGGNDDLRGSQGNDLLVGGGGNDVLTGGAGADVMKGRAGADIFVYVSGDETDTITDFEDGQDKIDLTDFNFASASEAKSYATNSNGHTAFDFGNGDVLTVENITLGSISGADLVL